MKLLFITTGYLPMPAYRGGAVNTLLDQYIKYNNKDEIVVYSIGSNTDKNYFDNNTEYRYIHKTKFDKFKTIIKGVINKLPFVNITRHYINMVVKDIVKRNETNKYDFVILENTPLSIPYISKNINSKIILHLHNDYLNIDTRLGKKIIDNTYKIICVSEFIKSRVDEISENNKTIVVYNGINFDKFNNNYDKKNLRKKYNISINKKVVLYVGRLLEKKGIFELIRSFVKINDKNSLLLIVGNGSKKIKNEINKYIKGNKNIILFDYVDNSKISEIYSLSDIGVVPSRCNEAFGLTVIEGLSCNLKMIVSNDGAIPELLTKQDTIIVDKNNLEEELYNNLKELLNSEIKVNNDLDYLHKKFSIEKHVKKIHDVFK